MSFRAGILQEPVQFSLDLGGRVINEGGRNVNAVFGTLAKVGDEFTDDHAAHNGFSHGVAAQAVKAVHIPAGCFARGKEAL